MQTLELMSEQEAEVALAQDMGTMSTDPYKFVRYSFPWGKVGTILEHRKIEPWQVAILCDLRDGLIDYKEALQRAVAAGHDVGKSALVAWIILWALSTLPDTRGVVTANTDKQLKSKTWPELSKWYQLFIAKHWFTLTATAIFSRLPGHELTWRFDAIPWDETQPEAFSGLHNQGRRAVMIFDEASAIHDKIWEATDGVMLDDNTELLWLAFGNPTRNTGRFHDAFHRFRHRWSPKHVDARDCSIASKSQIEKWRKDRGEDSDFFRVRVRGVFPKAEPDTLIPIDWIELAIARHIPLEQRNGPVVLACDVARYGDDDSSICPRNGRQIEPLQVVHGHNTMEVAGLCAQMAIDMGATEIHVDTIGLGAGVYDRLMERYDDDEDDFKASPVSINVSEKAMDEEAYSNARSEMWYAARESLNPDNPASMSLPDDPELAGDLSAVKTKPVDSRGRARIEPKEETKKRLGRSPDRGDSYAMSVYKSFARFAKPVARWALGHIPQSDGSQVGPPPQADWEGR